MTAAVLPPGLSERDFSRAVDAFVAAVGADAVIDGIAAHHDWGDHALGRFNETLEDAPDPNGILSPGKQGIWPTSMRAAAAP